MVWVYLIGLGCATIDLVATRPSRDAGSVNLLADKSVPQRTLPREMTTAEPLLVFPTIECVGVWADVDVVANGAVHAVEVPDGMEDRFRAVFDSSSGPFGKLSVSARSDADLAGSVLSMRRPKITIVVPELNAHAQVSLENVDGALTIPDGARLVVRQTQGRLGMRHANLESLDVEIGAEGSVDLRASELQRRVTVRRTSPKAGHGPDTVVVADGSGPITGLIDIAERDNVEVAAPQVLLGTGDRASRATGSSYVVLNATGVVGGELLVAEEARAEVVGSNLAKLVVRTASSVPVSVSCRVPTYFGGTTSGHGSFAGDGPRRGVPRPAVCVSPDEARSLSTSTIDRPWKAFDPGGPLEGRGNWPPVGDGISEPS